MTSASPPSELTLPGDFYSGSDSRRQAAELRLAGDALWLVTPEQTRLLSWPELRVSPRVGNTPRYLYLPDDGVFETADNQAVDTLTRRLHQGAGARLLHRLENHLGLILIAAVVTVGVTAFSFIYGVPWTARIVANSLPVSVADQLGEQTLDALDSFWMSPTELPEPRIEELRQAFEPYLAPVNGQTPRVGFRASAAIGANAFALPDGTLIFTDDMVHLAGNDKELVAILVHEIGHVAHRHGLQGVVQSSLVFWMAVMMTGDLSAFGDGTVAVPAFLLSLSYSRDLEREADDYALKMMQDHNLDPNHFANIMERLVQEHSDEEEGHSNETRDGEKGAGEKDWTDRAGQFLSSHPVSEERIRKFREAR